MASSMIQMTSLESLVNLEGDFVFLLTLFPPFCIFRSQFTANHALCKQEAEKVGGVSHNSLKGMLSIFAYFCYD